MGPNRLRNMAKPLRTLEASASEPEIQECEPEITGDRSQV